MVCVVVQPILTYVLLLLHYNVLYFGMRACVVVLIAVAAVRLREAVTLPRHHHIGGLVLGHTVAHRLQNDADAPIERHQMRIPQHRRNRIGAQDASHGCRQRLVAVVVAGAG